MRLIVIFSILGVLLVLAGCEQSALGTLTRENYQREQRIPIKEQELEDLDEQYQILESKAQVLLSELNNKQMTMDQLDARLNDLKRQNKLIKVKTEREKRAQEKRDLDIRRSQHEIDELRNDKQLSIMEKQKRIEVLKTQIRDNLEKGLR